MKTDKLAVYGQNFAWVG